MIKSSKVKQDKQSKAYKFRLIVANNDVERPKIVGCYQFVWNKALALVKQDDKDYHTIVQISKTNYGDGKGITPLSTHTINYLHCLPHGNNNQILHFLSKYTLNYCQLYLRSCLANLLQKLRAKLFWI
ncbi:MAG: hypothetical protein RLZZ293_287 [Pseudomonadota bacterium]|jgi:hypothetical protein